MSFPPLLYLGPLCPSLDPPLGGIYVSQTFFVSVIILEAMEDIRMGPPLSNVLRVCNSK